MSLSEKTKKWLAAECRPSFQDKTVLITGANSGIGLKMTEILLYLGARVIMACRSEQKADDARAALLAEYPDADISVMKLDMADFSSIDAFVQKLQKEKTDIDVFVNNAGVFRKPGQKTADGFELVIGTNYLGVFYLSEQMTPYLLSLRHEVDYINTVSMIHQIATVDYRDYYYEKRYGNFRVYARSKLSLAKYSYALARKYRHSSLRVYMTHPGIAMTPLGLNAYPGITRRMAALAGHLFNSPEKSALALPYLLSHRFIPGSIIGPTKLFGGWGYPKNNRVLKKVKTGADELITFTQKEIENHKG